MKIIPSIAASIAASIALIGLCLSVIGCAPAVPASSQALSPAAVVTVPAQTTVSTASPLTAEQILTLAQEAATITAAVAPPGSAAHNDAVAASAILSVVQAIGTANSPDTVSQAVTAIKSVTTQP